MAHGLDPYGSVHALGYAYGYTEIWFDQQSPTPMRFRRRIAQWGTSTALSAITADEFTLVPLKPAGPTFNRILLENGHLLNGTVVEVWSA